VQAFLQQTGLYCLAHPDRFPDDCSNIIFMLTKLSDDTTKWAQPLNQWPNSSPVSTATSLTLRARVRPSKLSNFKKSGNVDSYTEQFNIHTYNSAWSDNILVSLYRGGLKENIGLAIVSSEEPRPIFQTDLPP
ncbi:uncharacterized protein VP01_4610g2, partial [Puccinia sorghi]